MSKVRPTRSSGLMRSVRKFFVSAFVIATFVAYVLHERSTTGGDTALTLPMQKTTVLMPTVETPQAIGAPPDKEQTPLQLASPLAGALASPTAPPTSTQPPASPTAAPSPTTMTQPSPAALQTVVAAAQKLFTSNQPAHTAVAMAPTIESTATTAATAQPLPSPRPTVTVPPAPTPTSTTQALGPYKDGEYTGSTADAFYGWVQVDVLIQDSKLVDIQFLQYPDHRRTSVRINQRAAPILQREALQSQDAQVDLISGATLTSRAFRQSLQAALDAAKS